ncbi:MAG: terpene cyclase/mutase family protein [Planctomycetaceae bacterium]|nr:terpene cyclase/mutase family protein [Planctomycetaceae bacterium]
MSDQAASPDRAARIAESVKAVVIAAGTQSWLASLAIHLGLMVVLALVLGTIQVARVIHNAAQFEAVEEATLAVTSIEPIVLIEPIYEPTIIILDSLAAEPPATDPLSTSLSESLEAIGQPGGSGLPDAPLGSLDIPANGIGPLIRSALSTGPGSGAPASGIASPYSPRKGGPKVGATEPSEQAVAAALNWLARHQNSDGSWSLNHTPRCKSGFCSGPGQAQSDAAATALGLLPLLAAGQTHQSEGPYKKTVSGGINWLLKNQKPSGDLSAGAHQMYAHGLATIALCEAYGMTQDSRVGPAAQAAIRFIESGQNGQGSWRYIHGSDDSDTSVFGWQVMALKSGQMAGLKVNPASLDGSQRYLKLCASGKYGSEFSYSPGGRATSTMTSVGLLTSQYLGARRSDPVVLGGIEYLTKHPPQLNDRNTYYWYYATQAMHNVPGPEWDAWNRQMRRILTDTQERSGCSAGSWDPAKPFDDPWGSQGGRLMVTSLSCLTLEVYYRYLPLYTLDQ